MEGALQDATEKLGKADWVDQKTPRLLADSLNHVHLTCQKLDLTLGNLCSDNESFVGRSAAEQRILSQVEFQFRALRVWSKPLNEITVALQSWAETLEGLALNERFSSSGEVKNRLREEMLRLI